MKKKLLLIFLFSGITCFSQSADNTLKGSRVHKLRINDSVIKRLGQFKDSVASANLQADTTKIKADIFRNMDNILRLQREQNVKQKNGAIIRIAIGIAFLALLILGLKRRQK